VRREPGHGVPPARTTTQCVENLADRRVTFTQVPVVEGEQVLDVARTRYERAAVDGLDPLDAAVDGAGIGGVRENVVLGPGIVRGMGRHEVKLEVDRGIALLSREPLSGHPGEQEGVPGARALDDLPAFDEGLVPLVGADGARVVRRGGEARSPIARSLQVLRQGRGVVVQPLPVARDLVVEE
jgi:hypothetical protein